MIKERSKELLKKAFYRGNEVADMPSYYYEGLADEWEKWYSENVENILPLYVVSNPLPTKEEVIVEGDKQIKDWLMDNSFEERTAYRIGFRRSFEYVLRFIK